jgi:hypothetical protein
MNRFLKYRRLTGSGEAFRAHAVSHAGGFVISSRGHAAEALAWTKAVMTKLGLTLNEEKTSLKDASKERSASLATRSAPITLGRTANGVRLVKPGRWGASLHSKPGRFERRD